MSGAAVPLLFLVDKIYNQGMGWMVVKRGPQGHVSGLYLNGKFSPNLWTRMTNWISSFEASTGWRRRQVEGCQNRYLNLSPTYSSFPAIQINGKLSRNLGEMSSSGSCSTTSHYEYSRNECAWYKCPAITLSPCSWVTNDWERQETLKSVEMPQINSIFLSHTVPHLLLIHFRPVDRMTGLLLI